MENQIKQIRIHRACPSCQKESIVTVNEDDWNHFKCDPIGQRKFIQDYFPYLKPYQREILQTGICPKCWDRMFPDE